MSGLSRNIGAASRERDRRRRITATEDPFYMPVSMSPEYDAMYGTIHDMQEAGYGVNVYGSLARPAFDDYGGGGLNHFERESLKNQAISRASDVEAQRRREEDFTNQRIADMRQSEILGGLSDSYNRQAEAAAYAPPIVEPLKEKTVSPGSPDKYTFRPPPMTPREAMLSKIPTPARAAYEMQFAKQDLAARQADLEQAKIDETKRHNQAVEMAGTGAGRALTQTAESALISRLASQWDTANKANNEVNRQFNIMKTGLDRFDQDPNGASQAVLVTFQKMLDPESVVRESEYARSSSGIGLLSRMQGYMERLQRGGAGVPKSELEKMVKTAEEFRQNTQDAPASARKRIGAVADRYKIPHELIFSGADPTNASGMVELISPDGTERIPVPADQVEHYLGRGAKRVGG